MNTFLFAHSGHEHTEIVAAQDNSSALIIAGVVVAVVVALVIGLAVYDLKQKVTSVAEANNENKPS